MEKTCRGSRSKKLSRFIETMMMVGKELFFHHARKGSCLSVKLHGVFSASFSYIELLRPRKKSERKQLVTPINYLKRKSRKCRRERKKLQEMALSSPQNGLLVKNLLPVAHRVHSLMADLTSCVSRVSQDIPIYSCSVCGDIDVGHKPHWIRTCRMKDSLPSNHHYWERDWDSQCLLPLPKCFHLYDRLGKPVSHEKRLTVDQIPAVTELCVQAGVDLPDYPTKRRTFPVYSIAGKFIDFEPRFPKEDIDAPFPGFWQGEITHTCPPEINLQEENCLDAATRGMSAWEGLQIGVSKLMVKYAVQTCGFCDEVQVGPKGHTVRKCGAHKHQMRDGQHDWQQATVDDLIPPIYLWYSSSSDSTKALIHGLRSYYGKLPAVVKLFALVGAHVPERYASIMRSDMVVPELSELKLVV